MTTILNQADPDLQSMQVEMLNTLTPNVRVLLTAMVVADAANEPAYHTLWDIYILNTAYRKEALILTRGIDETRAATNELYCAGLVHMLQDRSRIANVEIAVSQASLYV